MSIKDLADDAIFHLKRVEEASNRIRPQSAQSSARQDNPAKLNEKEIAKALAEFLKSDNSISQAIAVRISNLADKYPNKAY